MTGRGEQGTLSTQNGAPSHAAELELEPSPHRASPARIRFLQRLGCLTMSTEKGRQMAISSRQSWEAGWQRAQRVEGERAYVRIVRADEIFEILYPGFRPLPSTFLCIVSGESYSWTLLETSSLRRMRHSRGAVVEDVGGWH